MTLKTCTKCKKQKNETEFSKNAGWRKHTQCKECANKYQKKRNKRIKKSKIIAYLM